MPSRSSKSGKWLILLLPNKALVKYEGATAVKVELNYWIECQLVGIHSFLYHVGIP